MYCARVEAVKAAVGRILVGRGSRSVVGKLSERSPSLPAVLLIVAGHAEVLLTCLDSSFTKSVCLGLVGSRKAEYYSKFIVEFFEKLSGELGTTV